MFAGPWSARTCLLGFCAVTRRFVGFELGNVRLFPGSMTTRARLGLLLMALVDGATAFVPPNARIDTYGLRKMEAPKDVVLRAVPDSSLLVALPTLVAPSEVVLRRVHPILGPFEEELESRRRARAAPQGQIAGLIANPYFIAFFLISVTTGLPFLTWLRLSSLGDKDAPYDASGLVPELSAPARKKKRRYVEGPSSSRAQAEAPAPEPARDARERQGQGRGLHRAAAVEQGRLGASRASAVSRCTSPA